MERRRLVVKAETAENSLRMPKMSDILQSSNKTAHGVRWERVRPANSCRGLTGRDDLLKDSHVIPRDLPAYAKYQVAIGRADRPARFMHEGGEIICIAPCFARTRMPSDTRLIAIGDSARPVVATLTARRTARGVEEVTEALVSLGSLDDPATDARADAAVEALDELAVAPWPLMAALFTRPGRADLTTSAFVAPTARPLALLIGAPAVRDLALDPATWGRRFGARIAGRPRTPALVIPLRRSEEPAETAWNRLVEITETLGVERVAELTGYRLDVDEWRSR